MEKSTINTFLYAKKSTESNASKLCDITSYPDLFATPEMIDVSDMSSRYKKYAEGMADVLNSPFGANYTKAAYDKIKAMEGDDTIVFELRFGEKGEYGAWTWTGSIFVNVKGGEVGGKRTMEITTYAKTEITETTVSDS